MIRLSDGALTVRNWGGPIWQPIVGDCDGDNANETSAIIPSSTNIGIYHAWSGAVGDVPVPVDYDRDGKTDAALYNAPTGIGRS